MCVNNNCCSCITRCGLFILNFIFFSLGVTMLVLALVINLISTYLPKINFWESWDFEEIINNLPDEAQHYLTTYKIFFFVVSSFIIFTSYIGSLTTVFGKKLSLSIYSILVFLLLVIQIVVMGLMMGNFEKVVNYFSVKMKDNIDYVKLANYKDLARGDCLAVSIVSMAIKCCGGVNATDFKDNEPVLALCCATHFHGDITQFPGCITQLETYLGYFKNYGILIANLIVIIVEVLILSMVVIVFIGLRNMNHEIIKVKHGFDDNNSQVKFLPINSQKNDENSYGRHEIDMRKKLNVHHFIKK